MASPSSAGLPPVKKAELRTKVIVAVCKIVPGTLLGVAAVITALGQTGVI